MSDELSNVNSNEIESLRAKKILEAINRADKLSQRSVFNPKAVSNDGLVLQIIDKAPFLTDLLSKIDGTGNAVINLVEVTGHVSTTVVGMTRGLQITGIVLDSFNVVRIPFIYLVSAMLGKKPPITLSNNAQWFYSVLLLSLAVVALTVPVTAPFIAIAASSLVSMVGLFTLGRLYYQRYQAYKVVSHLGKEMGILTRQLEEIKQNALNMKTALLQPEDEATQDQIIEKINELSNTFDDSKIQEITQNIQNIHSEKNQYNAFLKKEYRTEVMDKVVGITFSALAVVAALIALVFPPAALGILIGTGAVGSGYTVARILGALFSKSTASSPLVIKPVNLEVPMTNTQLEAEMKRVQDDQKTASQTINNIEISNVTPVNDAEATNTATIASSKESPLLANTMFHHNTLPSTENGLENNDQAIAIECKVS